MYQVNAEYTVCPSYPGCCIVPATVTDTQLEAAARYHVTPIWYTMMFYRIPGYTTLCRYRAGARFPVLAYLHAGTPLARATPPALPRPRGRRCVEDERLVASILGDRPRGFLLELASKGGPATAPGDTE